MKKKRCKNGFEPLFYQILMKMRLTIIFLCVTFLSGLAATSYSQSTKLTIVIKSTSIENVLREIEEQSEFRFFYNGKVDVDEKISANFVDRSITEILHSVFDGKPITYEVVGRQIVLTGVDGQMVMQQSRSISGIVRDSNGEPIPGVTVLIKGTTKGTITDMDGRFSMQNVTPDQLLIFSFVGMKPQEVVVGNAASIDVMMQIDAIGIEEVVAIGYGVVKKSDLTGSVSSLQRDDLNAGVNTSIDDLLLGKTAGVQITQASGEPGGGVTMQIRGASSIGASSDPLYVIDGFPIDNSGLVTGTGSGVVGTRTPRNPLASINPSDIESIEILKDASATAIYGSRGANGVILVTTKKGKTGSLSVNYSGYSGLQSTLGQVDVLNAKDYQRVLNEILDTPGSGVSEQERVAEIVDGGTNWQDELYENAMVQSHSLSLTGGNERTKFYASLNYFDQEGVLINSGYKRYDSRLNLDHKTDKLHFGVNFTTSFSHDDFASVGYGTNENSGILYAAINYDPTVPIYGDDGRYYSSNLINTDNPLALANGEISTADNYRTLGSFFGEYTILPGWTAKLNVGFDTRNSRRDVYVTQDTKDGFAQGGIATILTGTKNNYLGEFTTTYIKDINEIHSFTFLGGITYQKFIDLSTSSSGSGFPSDDLLTNNIGLADPLLLSVGSSKSNNKLLSYLGRVNYSLYDKYLFTVSIRADGSSRFGENNKFGYFPSAAFAWKMHDEQFIKDLDLFSLLKFRASIGRTGNQNIGNYRSLTTFGSGVSVALGGEEKISLEPERIANPNLKWETTEQINVGLDLGFLNNRVYVSMDYFQKNTYDMLFELPIPMSTGYSNILSNIGNIKNSGFEFMLDAKLIEKNFKWSTNFNFSTLKNEVTDLGGIPEIIHTGAGWTNDIAIIRPGETLNSFYGYEVLGVWQSDTEIAESLTTDPVKPGDLKYRDVNGDYKVNDKDKVVLGNSFPDFSFGLTNKFSYKNLGLTIFVDGVQGIEMLNNSLVETYYPISHRRNRVAEPYLNRWTETNPSDKYPSFVNPGSQGSKAVNTLTVEDASYIRLRTVKLNYDIPIRNKKVFDHCSVYVSGQNLFYLTNYSGVDPSSNSNGDASLKIDFNTYPASRMFIFGVEVGL